MTIRIGLIGVGFMGMTHFEAARQVTNGRITAIATRNEKKLRGDWSDIQGNFGPRGSAHVDLSGVAGHADSDSVRPDVSGADGLSVAGARSVAERNSDI